MKVFRLRVQSLAGELPALSVKLLQKFFRRACRAEQFFIEQIAAARFDDRRDVFTAERVSQSIFAGRFFLRRTVVKEAEQSPGSRFLD